MPISIVAALAFWISALAPASSPVPESAVVSERQVDADRSDLVWSAPVSAPYNLALLDADDREEETSDEDPVGLSAATSWLADFVLTEGRVSPIGREPASFRHLDRSSILRC